VNGIKTGTERRFKKQRC